MTLGDCNYLFWMISSWQLVIASRPGCRQQHSYVCAFGCDSISERTTISPLFLQKNGVFGRQEGLRWVEIFECKSAVNFVRKDKEMAAELLRMCAMMRDFRKWGGFV
jgi:hypothetical protein